MSAKRLAFCLPTDVELVELWPFDLKFAPQLPVCRVTSPPNLKLYGFPISSELKARRDRWTERQSGCIFEAPNSASKGRSHNNTRFLIGTVIVAYNAQSELTAQPTNVQLNHAELVLPGVLIRSRNPHLRLFLAVLFNRDYRYLKFPILDLIQPKVGPSIRSTVLENPTLESDTRSRSDEPYQRWYHVLPTDAGEPTTRYTLQSRGGKTSWCHYCHKSQVTS